MPKEKNFLFGKIPHFSSGKLPPCAIISFLLLHHIGRLRRPSSVSSSSFDHPGYLGRDESGEGVAHRPINEDEGRRRLVAFLLGSVSPLRWLLLLWSANGRPDGGQAHLLLRYGRTKSSSDRRFGMVGNNFDGVRRQNCYEQKGDCQQANISLTCHVSMAVIETTSSGSICSLGRRRRRRRQSSPSSPSPTASAADTATSVDILHDYCATATFTFLCCLLLVLATQPRRWKEKRRKVGKAEGRSPVLASSYLLLPLLFHANSLESASEEGKRKESVYLGSNPAGYFSGRQYRYIWYMFSNHMMRHCGRKTTFLLDGFSLGFHPFPRGSPWQPPSPPCSYYSLPLSSPLLFPTGGQPTNRPTTAFYSSPPTDFCDCCRLLPRPLG